MDVITRLLYLFRSKYINLSIKRQLECQEAASSIKSNLLKSFHPLICPTLHQPKVSKFGLVRILEGTTMSPIRVVGTPGYVDPAYSRTNKAMPMADLWRVDARGHANKACCS
ncbi:unnamed protein product [Closterium sp. NIES-53]